MEVWILYVWFWSCNAGGCIKQSTIIDYLPTYSECREEAIKQMAKPDVEDASCKRDVKNESNGGGAWWDLEHTW